MPLNERNQKFRGKDSNLSSEPARFQESMERSDFQSASSKTHRLFARTALLLEWKQHLGKSELGSEETTQYPEGRFTQSNNHIRANTEKYRWTGLGDTEVVKLRLFEVS